MMASLVEGTLRMVVHTELAGIAHGLLGYCGHHLLLRAVVLGQSGGLLLLFS